MKKSRLVITTLILILCIGVLSFGVYATIPTQTEMVGTLSIIPGVGIDVDVQMFVNGSEVEPTGGEEVYSISPNQLNLIENGEYQDQIVTLKIKNNSSEPIGAYFYSGNNANKTGLAKASDVKTAETLNSVIDVNFSNYTYIKESDASGTNDEKEMNVTFSLQNGASSTANGSLNFSYYLYIEPYIPNEEFKIQSALSSTKSFMNAVSLASAGEYITTLPAGKNDSNRGMASFSDKLVKIPVGVTTIPSYAFPTDLKSVVMPDTVQTISNNAFSNTTGLNSFEISDTVTSVAGGAFSGCSGLTSMTIPFTGASADATGAESYFGYIFGTTSYDGGTLIDQMELKYYVPTKLKTITLTSEVVKAESFAGCATLSTVSLPNATVINDYAFYYCVELNNVNMPEALTIGTSSFNYCTSLSSVSMNNVTEIGTGAFSECIAINDVYYGGTLEDWCNISISSSPFEASYNLVTKHNLYLKGQVLNGNITIPDSITTISKNTFCGYNRITSVSMPKVTSIDAGAFENCLALTSVSMPEVLSIDGGAFGSCSALVSISMPKVTSILPSAFDFCSALTSVTVPNSLQTISMQAFRGCSGLTEITIPFTGETAASTGKASYFGYIFGQVSYPGGTKVTQGGVGWLATKYDFYIPTSLKKVTFTGTAIKAYAFQNCTMLESIVISHELTSVASTSFTGCSSSLVFIYNGTLDEFKLITNYTTISNNYVVIINGTRYEIGTIS